MPVVAPSTAAVVGAVAHTAGPAAALGSLIGGLQPPVLSMLEGTLTHPFQLGPAVDAAWATMRDVAAGLLLAALLYGALRAQVAGVADVDAGRPWQVLPRLPLAAIGVATSLPLVRGLLAANNALCAAILRELPQGAQGLLRPLAAGLALGLLPAVLDIGTAVAALLVLVGVAALACFYVVRAAEIVLLALLLPLAAALWVVPEAAGVWRALFGELLVAIFVQAAQVAVLLVFASGMAGAGAPGSASWLWALGALALLFRCRHLLGAAVRAGAQWAPHPGQVAGGARTVVATAARGAQRLGAVAGWSRLGPGE